MITEVSYDIITEPVSIVGAPNAPENPVKLSGLGTTGRSRTQTALPRTPEHTVHIEHNCSAGSSYYAQYHNNIISKINIGTCISPSDTEVMLGVNKARGIYITETYNIMGMPVEELERFIGYYTHSKGFSYCEDTQDDIRKILTGLRPARNASITKPELLEIVTYIPETEMADREYAYIHGPGIAVIKGVPDHSAAHPYSVENLHTIDRDATDALVSTSIDITLVSPTREPAYVMVANKVVTVRPTRTARSSVLPPGLAIHINNAGVDEEHYYDIKDLEDVGFYRTREECLAGNDKLALLANAKMEHELEKLKLDNAKLELANANLVAGNERLVIDQQVKTSINKMDISKKQMELTHMRNANELDLDTKVAKLEIDTASKVADLKLNAAKHVMGVNEDTAKHNMSMFKGIAGTRMDIMATCAKAQADIAAGEAKHVFEQRMQYMRLVDTGAKLLGTIGKII